ncbi:MAG: phosphocholine cytidylyltransferase family protein [archaeon]
MKLIILAAGIGTRLMPLTRNTPKPLVDFGEGMTLLERQLDSIQKSGVIDEVVLVVGYLAHQIEAKISSYEKNGLKIKTIYNPFYATSNNLVSLWFAKPEMTGDFMITNGDNVFEPEVFRDFVQNSSEGIILSIRKKDLAKYQASDMKVTLTERNTASRVSKEIEHPEIHAESPGLVKVSGERHIKVYKDILEELVRSQQHMNNFWLETFTHLHEKGYDVHTHEIDGEKWIEVDFHAELDYFRKLFKEKPQSDINADTRQESSYGEGSRLEGSNL